MAESYRIFGQSQDRFMIGCILFEERCNKQLFESDNRKNFVFLRLQIKFELVRRFSSPHNR